MALGGERRTERERGLGMPPAWEAMQGPSPHTHLVRSQREAERPRIAGLPGAGSPSIPSDHLVMTPRGGPPRVEPGKRRVLLA